ncbi:hypothetical protein NHQ30_007712 [Ciborinia camelliae]|nr:hypothetical protein NHQ30_007712 [Ciborinia camelliae]
MEAQANEVQEAKNQSIIAEPRPFPHPIQKSEADEISKPKSTGVNIGEELSELSPQAAEVPGVERLQGWRLYGTTFSANACVFLANLEVAIVSTSLVAITDDLKSFARSTWIITAYILTYTGFLIIWAKLSDSLGRRQCLCAALAIFVVASGACGGARTTSQLIVFRAFQGIGGSGLLSIPYVILPEMVEVQKYALWASFTSFAFVLGFLIGPLLGGAIAGGATWRWVFLINLPLGVITFILLFIFMPFWFPDLESERRSIHVGKLKDIDFLGVTLVFATSAFIVSALQEAGTTYAWSSAPIIVLLVLTCVSVFGFLVWEYHVDKRMETRQPVLTWRLLKNRVFMGALLISFFAGVPFTVAVIQIPQEWQTVANTTALVAGIRLLPFTLFYTFGLVLAMILTSKLHIPVLTPQLIQGRDQSIAMGAITQFRALGSVVGLSIATNVFNDYVRTHLSRHLTPEQLSALLQSVTSGIDSLPLGLQATVRSTFGAAYDLQTKVMIGFAIAQALAVSIMWERTLRRLL